MKLEWILDKEKQLDCPYPRCELPWDHIVLANGVPRKMDEHMGRSRAGRWANWT